MTGQIRVLENQPNQVLRAIRISHIFGLCNKNQIRIILLSAGNPIFRYPRKSTKPEGTAKELVIFGLPRDPWPVG